MFNGVPESIFRGSVKWVVCVSERLRCTWERFAKYFKAELTRLELGETKKNTAENEM